jgi:hypothetical protein
VRSAIILEKKIEEEAIADTSDFVDRITGWPRFTSATILGVKRAWLLLSIFHLNEPDGKLS